MLRPLTFNTKAYEKVGAYGSAEDMVKGFLLRTTASSPR